MTVNINASFKLSESNKEYIDKAVLEIEKAVGKKTEVDCRVSYKNDLFEVIFNTLELRVSANGEDFYEVTNLAKKTFIKTFRERKAKLRDKRLHDKQNNIKNSLTADNEEEKSEE